MTPKIRYVETSDELKVRYAEYQEFFDNKCFELLDIDPAKAQERLKELRAGIEQGHYKSLSVKWGFCWAVYDSGGYTMHEVLTHEDFIAGAYLVFGLEIGVTSTILNDEHSLKNYIHHVHHKPEIEGTLREFDVRFGSKVPEDYYGNYDYSKYPGGYSPSDAFYGEDDD
ncbi:hypothetical protein PS850_03802 [Pseudomonas fluorescens]|nr:hypothetical protein PS850_03802 [Pseudomonas fluorescens]